MADTKKQSEKYIDLISQSSKDAEKETLQFHAEDAELQVTSSILATKKEISKAKRTLNEAKKAIPYSLEDEVKATINLKDLQDGLTIAEQIQKERF